MATKTFEITFDDLCTSTQIDLIHFWGGYDYKKYDNPSDCIPIGPIAILEIEKDEEVSDNERL